MHTTRAAFAALIGIAAFAAPGAGEARMDYRADVHVVAGAGARPARPAGGRAHRLRGAPGAAAALLAPGGLGDELTARATAAGVGAAGVGSGDAPE